LSESERAKRVVQRIYSWAADTVYDPLVVRGAFRVFGGRLNELVIEQGRRAVRHAKGRAILDLPVGTAAFTVEMADRHEGIVVGADIAEGMVRAARDTAGRKGVRNLAPIQADAHRLPFRNGSFYAVLCTNGLQVMPGLRPTLAELRRVVAEDGVLYVSVVNMPIRSDASAPTMFLSRSRLRVAIEEAGFAVVDLRRERFATLIEAAPR
jgi:ubiquinone/menaquinone biosynthesis C-methylase UbiE